MKIRTVSIALLLFLVILPSLLLWRAHNSLKQYEGLRPGDTLPLARLQTPDGQPVETGSWFGTPTVLIVFNPDCQPCRSEIRNLASIAPRFPDLRIALLSTRTSPGSLQAAFPVYVDRDGAFLNRSQRLVTPALYWIGASGKIRYARLGQRDATEDEELFRKLQDVEK